MNEQSPAASLQRFFAAPLAETDPELAAAIGQELVRQQDGIELIASENIVSAAVLEAQGSVLTNKYAEGYPGRRYYGGCDYVDVAETARDRPREATVRLRLRQCAAAFRRAGQPGGVPGAAAAGRHDPRHEPRRRRPSDPWRRAEPVRQMVQRRAVRRARGMTGCSTTRSWKPLARAEKPKLIIAGGSAYPRVIDFARIRAVADEVGAYFMVDMAHFAGLVAAGIFPTPLPHAHVVTTTTHKTLRGPRGGMVLTNDEEIGKKINSAIFPGLQGGPLMHVIAAKAVAFGEALRPEFRAYQQAVVDECQGAWRRRWSSRGSPSSPAAPTAI